MSDCTHLKRNVAHCNCTYSGCQRHGRCCECISYHRFNGELPACYFDEAGEKTYDRSIESFIKSR